MLDDMISTKADQKAIEAVVANDSTISQHKNENDTQMMNLTTFSHNLSKNYLSAIILLERRNDNDIRYDKRRNGKLLHWKKFRVN